MEIIEAILTGLRITIEFSITSIIVIGSAIICLLLWAVIIRFIVYEILMMEYTKYGKKFAVLLYIISIPCLLYFFWFIGNTYGN